ncbi:hypothetical protein SAMN05421630_106123 [Prauserella marina]|uniref:Uncharacterized protein n=1 Tax=Prauserella marina TaxID=530584 RepID=A0A1G6SDC6_9PSEU|nr:hypothetical protein [Prauserella marina]PWV81889.1 hypothetical protein DES30_102123 [Prauserella marina]SDD14671.1 hypothetical protein SAMN05421630_106123 [Prauserella marina]
MIEHTPHRPLCPKVILEGTRLTKKTELAFALNEHPRFVGPRKYRYHSPIISAEWSGLTNEAWGPSLIDFPSVHEGKAMETYATWARLFELHRYYSWIVDRFHLSTQVYQARRAKHIDFRWLESRLRPLGFAVVFCHREPTSFRQAREERLTVSGNPAQYDDLSVFVREQEDLLGAAIRGGLPVLELDVTDRGVEELADTVVDWYERQNLLKLDC